MEGRMLNVAARDLIPPRRLAEFPGIGALGDLLVWERRGTYTLVDGDHRLRAIRSLLLRRKKVDSDKKA
jgi:hypothetical protein